MRPALAAIAEVDRVEREAEEYTTYRQCFQGTNLRRTIISMVAYASAVTTGTVFINSLAYFMQRMSSLLILYAQI